MKKGLLFLLILMVILISACSPLDKSSDSDETTKEDTLKEDNIEENPPKDDTPKENPELAIDDFYPYLENTVLEYEGIGIEFAEESRYFEFIDGNRAQLKIKNPGTTMVKILENKDGALREIFSQGEFYHIENLLNTDETENDILLKEPIELGNSWKTIDGYTRKITGVDVEVKTPYKTFKALEVVTEKDGAKEINYYSSGIGLVASIYQDKDMKIETLLKSIKYEAKKLAIEKYYPIDIDADIVYVDGEISFETNGSIEEKLTEILKNPPSEKLIPLISEKTKINSINLDRSNWKLRVDFSQELIDDMNYGTTMETKVLESIVNTLGRFYDVDGVSLTVDGSPYESGHYYLKEDEYFEVQVKDLEKFNP